MRQKAGDSMFDYSSPEVLDYAEKQKQLILDGQLNPKSFHLPKFFCIGAQKAGTTWLYVNLKRHPQFRFKAKEIHYFDVNRHFSKPLEYYSELFNFGQKKVFTGDITPGYSVLREGRLKLMKILVPDAKFIFLVRNPIERAWSSVLMHFGKNKGMEMKDVSIDEILSFLGKAEVLNRGNYLDTIKRYTAWWPEENLFVGFYEQISSEPEKLYQDILDHLGAKKDFDISSLALNEVIHKRQADGEMPEEIRAFLEENYRAKINEMKKLWGDRIDHW